MATQLATVADKRVDPLRQAIEQMAPEFKMALPAHVTPEKFVRVSMTAINGNPELREADRRSLFQAVTKLAQDGLLPDGREAALVIFNTKNRQTNQWEKRVQAMPMIAGLLKLMRQSGEVAWVDAHLVCANDRFVYRPGLDDVPEFEPDWFGDRGEPIGAYAIAKLKTGEIVPPEIMSIAAIEKVRAVSRSKDKGPWVDWWEQQALKTVLRRFLKRLPTSADIDHAFDRDETMQAQFDGGPALAVEHEPAPRLTRLEAIEQQIEPTIEAQVETVEAEIDQRSEADDASPNEPAPEPPAAQAQPDERPLMDRMKEMAGLGDGTEQEAADAWIAKFTGCETIAALDEAYRESAADRAVLPKPLKDAVEKARDAAEARLKGGK